MESYIKQRNVYTEVLGLFPGSKARSMTLNTKLT
jgi:hypothetical protein